ncbi:MAG: M81 family metallopeptidase, partial [Roseibium sp.]|nr:M81 family metallopeptidase [Roseibium sp.]
MRVFCASIATETNTFSPLRTDFSDFAESFYAAPGDHPKTPTLCSGVFPALRERSRRGEITLIEGTATWAEPGGLVNKATWERLRDEVLDQLRAACPVEAVV